MGETCEVCGLELASVETRNLYHSGELVKADAVRRKCLRDVTCWQRGYDNAAKVALKLSVEVSEQKARADAADVECRQLVAALAVARTDELASANAEIERAWRSNNVNVEALADEKVRADAAEAILAEYRGWSPSRTDLIEALAAARRENQRLVQMIEDLRAGAVEHGLKCSIWPDDPGHHANFCGSFNGENCPLCAALAAPAAGEELDLDAIEADAYGRDMGDR